MIITSTQEYGFAIFEPTGPYGSKERYKIGNAHFYDNNGNVIGKEEKVAFKFLPTTMRKEFSFDDFYIFDASCYFERTTKIAKDLFKIELYSCRLKKFATLEITTTEKKALRIRQIASSPELLFLIYFSTYDSCSIDPYHISGKIYSENGDYCKDCNKFFLTHGKFIKEIDIPINLINQYQKVVRIGNFFWTEPDKNFVNAKGEVLLHLKKPPREIEKCKIFYKSDSYNNNKSESCYLIQNDWISGLEEDWNSISIFSNDFKKTGTIEINCPSTGKLLSVFGETELKFPFIDISNKIYSFSGKCFPILSCATFILSKKVGQHSYYFLYDKLFDDIYNFYLIEGNNLQLLFANCTKPLFSDKLQFTNKTTGAQEQKSCLCVDYEKDRKLFHEIYILEEDSEKVELKLVKVFSYCKKENDSFDPFSSSSLVEKIHSYIINGHVLDSQNFKL